MLVHYTLTDHQNDCADQHYTRGSMSFHYDLTSVSTIACKHQELVAIQSIQQHHLNRAVSRQLFTVTLELLHGAISSLTTGRVKISEQLSIATTDFQLQTSHPILPRE